MIAQEIEAYSACIFENPLQRIQSFKKVAETMDKNNFFYCPEFEFRTINSPGIKPAGRNEVCDQNKTKQTNSLEINIQVYQFKLFYKHTCAF